MNNTKFYKLFWQEKEKNYPLPRKSRNIIKVEFNEFEKILNDDDEIKVKKIIDNLYSGDFYLIKNTFSTSFLNRIKKGCFEHFSNSPSTFYKMLEGTPDFQRKIDIETGKKYSFKRCSHSFYFYRWNNDPLNLFGEIDKKWRLVKKLMGLDFNAYEKNTPKDGVIDRVQLVKYPSSIGFLEPHSDPYKYQKLFISGYMSKKDQDFTGLGFYLIDQNDKIVEIENDIDIGDVGLGYSTVQHGVAPVNINKNPDWDDINDGRWFLSMYSNQSDEVKERHTGHSLENTVDIINQTDYQIRPIIKHA
tara:strand:- start:28 stop:936 length:909 start_codon:yes stop_codon:yes gene_type:complete